MKPIHLLALALLQITSAHAADLLKVDFGTTTSPTESGFIGQSATGATHPTTAGNITVSFTGQSGTFDRGATGPAGVDHNLYRDFIFDNTAGSPAMTITLTGPGVSANTNYLLTFYAFDSNDTRTTSFAGASGTVGTTLGPVTVTTSSPDPTTLGDYSVTGIFTSSNDGDGTGTLTFNVNSTGRSVVNGFIIATSGPDTNPPIILPANIVDDKGGADVLENTLVTYTLTFSEDIDATSVSAADFSNAGSSPVSFGAITEVTPGVFTVAVTPTGAGTLRLQIPSGATILDTAGLPMDTAAATLDNTTLNVVVAPPDNTKPTPNPMTFAVVPYATSVTSIAMVATTATDNAGVEYFFDETSGNPGGDDSGWQPSPTYQDTGLTTGQNYTYTVTARDFSPNQNTTDPSAPASATAQTPVVPPIITAPTSRHIVQRSSTNLGTIVVAGTYSVGVPDSIQARAVVMAGAGNNGTTTPWQTIHAAPSGGTFSGSLSNVPAGGWYQIEVRSVISGTPGNAAVLEKVGVGDIYVTAGQSNSANFAANQAPQDDRISARTSTTNSTWVLATAPLPISNGSSGTVWTWLANRLIAAQNVPIGIVSCGIGGSAASSWTVGGGNYNTYLKPAVKSFPVNGFKAALWHQGESDSNNGVSATTHSGYLAGMISGTRTEAGWNIPWYIPEATFHGDSNLTKQEPVAAGQRMTVHGDPLTFLGPTTDEFHLTGGGSLHFNAVGTDNHARQWAEILLGNVTFGPINGTFETHGWIEYAAPNPKSPTPLADGASTILDIVTTGQMHRVLNWRILASGGLTTASGSNGFHNPTTGTFAGAVDSVNGGVLPNMSGKHVAMLDGGSAGNYFLQSTRSLAAANTTYTLSVALGVRDIPASFGNARLEITSNGTVVASGTFSKTALDTLAGTDAAGKFTNASISWTSGTTVAANQPLGIRIVKEGGTGTVLDFDNVRFTATPANDFNSWIGSPGFGLALADRDFGDDPDGDGLKNGIEAWFGTHPGQSNAGLANLAATDTTTTTFSHPKNPSPPSGVNGSYEWSPNLTDWYPGGGGPGGGSSVSFVPVTVGTTTTVTATASEALQRLFLRVKMTQN